MNTFTKNNSLLLSSKIKSFIYDPNKLVLVYDTSKESANNTISFPVNGVTPNITVNWGDNTSDVYTTTGWKTHNYANPGIYVVQVSGFMRALSFGSSGPTFNNKPKLVRCLSFGNIGLNFFTSGFRNCVNLIEVPKSLPATTNISFMFSGCTNFNSDISLWNTSGIITMSNTFAGCSNFNQSLSSWNVSQVTNMSYMFFDTDSFSSNLGSWNLSGLNLSLSLSQFMANATGMSVADYNATLIGWNNNKASFRNDLIVNFGGSKYSSAAASARAALIAYGWTITDGGLTI